MMSGLYVSQSGQSYAIYTPQGEQIALVFTGYDGQYMQDAVAIAGICKILGKRWKIPPKQNQG